MGSFNHKGNLSNLPIEYGDKVVCMIGLRCNNSSDTFSPGFSFTPISLPIRGEYDDYGSVQNVVKTPGVEYLEKFFGMSVEDVIGVAERCESGCENQVKGGYDIIMEKINEMLPDYTFGDCSKYTFGYFMEHESVFDRMVRDGNFNLASAEHRYDSVDWKSRFLEELGYKNQDGNKWVHPEYETLVQDSGYFYLESDEGGSDYSVYPVCYKDFFELIGCDVPEKYKKSWYEMKFEQDMTNEKPEHWLFCSSKNDFYFVNNYNVYGFFYGGEYYNGKMLAMIFNTKEYGHLKEEYKSEFVELAAFLRSMITMNMTWGVSNYYSQTCKYSFHKNFINACAEIIDNKINKKD